MPADNVTDRQDGSGKTAGKDSLKVLILGGTGAMGYPLSLVLAERGHQVYVTSRKEHTSDRTNIHYLQGNAMEDGFLRQTVSDRYDAIVDFMHYRPDRFRERMELLLDGTERYLFLSSSKVYAPSKSPLQESSPRLLDVVEDDAYLATEEYALSKARIEDMLLKSGRRNWTVIRPYITYNTERLQLGLFEKEAWLYRALRGRSIVFSKDLAACRTSLTYGGDVARAMAGILENPQAGGQLVHIVCGDSMTWGEVLDLYVSTLREKTGKEVPVYMTEKSEDIARVVGNSYKLRYDRLSDRVFNSSKADELCQQAVGYTPMAEGLKKALSSFLAEEVPNFKRINWKLQGYLDSLAGERTPLGEIPDAKEKVKYLICRYTPYLKWKYRNDTWW